MSKAVSRQDWEQRAAALQIQGQAFVAGQYQPAISGETFDCVSPIDGRVLAQIASCDQADADQAVVNARAVFDSGVWSRKSPVQRKRIMQRFADLIEQHREELALLETLDMGKPIGDSLAVDITGAARSIRWSAEAIDKVYDEVAPTAHDELGLVTREPVGVVAAIVPWNFPLLMASWKLGPALATGNSVALPQHPTGIFDTSTRRLWNPILTGSTSCPTIFMAFGTAIAQSGARYWRTVT